MKGRDMKEMKIPIYLGELEGSLDDAIALLRASAEGLTDVRVELGRAYSEDLLLIGHRPMTDAERSKAKEAARKRAERRKN